MAEQCHDRAEALYYEPFPFRMLFYNSAVHGESNNSRTGTFEFPLPSAGEDQGEGDFGNL
jgi:hypothetical protein